VNKLKLYRLLSDQTTETTLPERVYHMIEPHYTVLFLFLMYCII